MMSSAACIEGNQSLLQQSLDSLMRSILAHPVIASGIQFDWGLISADWLSSFWQGSYGRPAMVLPDSLP
jgi:hypothetical protein